MRQSIWSVARHFGLGRIDNIINDRLFTYSSSGPRTVLSNGTNEDRQGGN